jgi:hypothetical protein
MEVCNTVASDRSRHQLISTCEGNLCHMYTFEWAHVDEITSARPLFPYKTCFMEDAGQT